MEIEHNNDQTKAIFNSLLKRHNLTYTLNIPKTEKNNLNHINKDQTNIHQLETPITESSLYHSNDSTYGTEWSAAGLFSN